MSLVVRAAHTDNVYVVLRHVLPTQEPQLFKLIYGGTLGLFITPVIALAALMAKGKQPTNVLS